MSAIQKSSPRSENFNTADPISPISVRTFRQRAIENGYRLLRVRTNAKTPVPKGWQHGDQPGLLLDVQLNGLNTGLLLGDLRCIDCDVDDWQVALNIAEAVLLYLPEGALVRRRASSARFAMLFRAAEGEPPKRSITGPKGCSRRRPTICRRSEPD